MEEEDDERDRALFDAAVYAGFVFSLLFFLFLSKLAAPYGRHLPRQPSPPAGEGKSGSSSPGLLLLPTRVAWAIMESPALILTALVFAQGRHRGERVPRVLLLFFLAHYFQRVVVYPLRMPATKARNVPLSVMLSSIIFNIYNAYIQGRSLSHYTAYPSVWLLSARFLAGACLFAAGMGINVGADSVLLSLRKDDQARTSSSSLYASSSLTSSGGKEDQARASNSLLYASSTSSGRKDNHDQARASNSLLYDASSTSSGRKDDHDQARARNSSSYSCPSVTSPGEKGDQARANNSSSGSFYKIPRGGLFEYVTCPNYLGELMEWLGWAILTWSPAGLAFFLLTAGNLVPRAISHHRWYRQHFPSYPPSRKILIPSIF